MGWFKKKVTLAPAKGTEQEILGILIEENKLLYAQVKGLTSQAGLVHTQTTTLQSTYQGLLIATMLKYTDVIEIPADLWLAATNGQYLLNVETFPNGSTKLSVKQQEAEREPTDAELQEIENESNTYNDEEL